MPSHEDRTKLKPETLDRERASQSLREELEAIDWYQERIEATQNNELRRILEHNRDEEKEHAAMLIEWLRKNDSVFDSQFEEHD
ncbi:MAG: ferritin [bacterium]